MKPLIRPSTLDDLSAITRIYAHHVLHGTGSFEIDPPDVAEMTRRREDVLSRGLPYLVAELDQQVVGYAYANVFRPRPAYRFAVENSVYVDATQHRSGLGRALMHVLLERCETAGMRQMVAVIGDSANLGSIGLHTSMGFQPAGVLRSTGWKQGRWLDTVFMQRPLGPGDSQAPAAGA
jgi:phosphinothricin acetyltransferase